MAEILISRPLSDADESYWTVKLNITEDASPSNSNCPPEEGLLSMDLRFNKICLFVFQDEYGNPGGHTQHYEHFSTAVPTLHLPGTLNRSEYYTALHQWLQSLEIDDFPSLEPVQVTNFTNNVTDRVFKRVELLEKAAICVQADLNHVSLEYDNETFPMRSEGIEYDDEEELKDYVEKISDCCRVVAAEEHRRFGDCSICLEDLVPAGEENYYLFGSPCGHFFHGECMEKWLWMSDSCPLCRFDVSSIIEEEE